MTFLQNNKRESISKKIAFGGLIIALLLLFVNYRDDISSFLSKPALFISRPVISMAKGANIWISRQLSVFKDKKNLQEENNYLKEKILELESKIASLEISEKEGIEIKSLLSRETPGRQFILSGITSRPPRSPYDVLVIDAGKESGIRQGAKATAFGNVLIGYVSEVFENTSKIKMLSYPKEETDAIFASSTIASAAIGTGGGNFEVTIPRDVNIEVGERMITPEVYPYLIGVVEKIKNEESDPFQKIFLRVPVNISELRYLLIEK